MCRPVRGGALVATRSHTRESTPNVPSCASPWAERRHHPDYRHDYRRPAMRDGSYPSNCKVGHFGRAICISLVRFVNDLICSCAVRGLADRTWMSVRELACTAHKCAAERPLYHWTYATAPFGLLLALHDSSAGVGASPAQISVCRPTSSSSVMTAANAVASSQRRKYGD
jgi:hypothetical protein